MSTLTLPVEHRVASGARWMDEHYPGWTSFIELDHLDLDDPSHCILGQAAGGYWNVVTATGIDGLTSDDARTLGFVAQYGGDDREERYAQLQRDNEALNSTWRQVIAARRN